jgi:hypothetical protein
LAESLQAVTVKTVLNPVGYGYEIQAGPKADWVKKKAASWLEANRGAIAEVAREFGGCSASDLELGATIIYADRELAGKEALTQDDLVRRVREVKPRFTEQYVRAKVRDLATKGYLRGAAPDNGHATPETG